MKSRSIAAICFIICFTLIFIGLMFWPTLYRYDHVERYGKTEPIRIHRITGEVEYLLDLKKDSEKEINDKIVKQQPLTLSHEELMKVTGKATLTKYGDFRVYIYNGSNSSIGTLKFKLITKKKDGTIIWAREYTGNGYSRRIKPLTNDIVQIVVEPTDFDSFEWDIVEATKSSFLY